jgi:SAM-dependent methyltransferase
MTTQTQPHIDTTRVEEFAERVGRDQDVGVAGVLAYIGDRLGIWASLAGSGWLSAEELGARSGLDATYLAEWLAAQAAAHYVEYDESTGRFRLPPEHAAVLADESSPAASAGGFEFLAGCWADADRVADLFVTGEGLSWGERDRRLVNGATRFFRPLYEQSLLQQWLPAVDGLVATLEEGARVLDVGCGQGLSTLLMGRAFERSTFLGIDPDGASLTIAAQAAGDEGLGNVAFEVRGADEADGGDWDLVCVLDAFHHIGDPTGAATALRGALAPGGRLLVVEPRSEDSVAANLQTAGALYYGPSTVLCIPDALAQEGDSALGAQAGPSRLLGILADAGFTGPRVAATTDFNLVIEASR